MLYTPLGEPARNLERIVLLALWAEQLEREMQAGIGAQLRPPIIHAGIGKPTFPINADIIQSSLNYWQQLQQKNQVAANLIAADPELSKDTRNQIAQLHASVNYGDPMGDLSNRVTMAAALDKWYGQVGITANHILFTVGGIGSLFNIFEVINRRYPGGIIVTPFPHYPLYIGPYGINHLFPIELMDQQGYRLTAELLAKALEEASVLAKSRGTRISAFLFCDPNNPLGTALTAAELQAIAEVLRQYPDIYIIVDEAYAELRFNSETPLSLLSVAPDLQARMMLLRLGTKGFSAAGERMGVTICFDLSFMNELIEENLFTCIHPPRSLQHAFAEAMAQFDAVNLQNLKRYYQPQVQYVSERLKQIGAAMPDPHYQVEGTFYVLGDFSRLFGLELPPDAKRALHRYGPVRTDEDIAYYLLFNDGLMITPLSYFGGIAPESGFLRITCSGGDQELETLLDRLEKRLQI